jgi:PAS domain S-box-containing protein
MAMVPHKVNSGDLSTCTIMIRAFAYLAVFCVFCGFPGSRAVNCMPTSEQSYPQRKNVLVLLPENLGFEGQMAFVQNLKASLDVSETVELYTESIDLKELQELQTAKELEELYRAKYKDVRLDLIIAGERPVLEFLLKRRRALFPGVPIVFAMIPKDSAVPVVQSPEMTGSLASFDFAKTVELALTLQPETTRVILISGTSQRDRWMERIAREQFQPLVGRVQFAYWEGLTPLEIKERFKELKETDVFFYLAESEDHAGHAYSLEQYLDRIAPDSPVAIYSSLSQLLGRGVVGGNLYDNTDEARMIAQQAKQILTGRSPGEIPVADVTMTEAVDERQLTRWRIPVSRVPLGTDLRFREPTIWEKHKFGIVSVITFIALETALIFLLWIQVRRKNAARRMVERRFATEQVVTEYSEKFRHCAPEEVDEQIQHGLAAIRKAEEVDWALWFTVEPSTREVEKSYVATDEAISEKAALRLAGHTPWLMEQIEAAQAVTLSDLAQLPDQAQEDRDYLLSLGVKSVLIVPSLANGDTRSALLMASRESGREWPNALIARLATVGNLFGTAVHRRRAEVELKDKKEWLEMALEASRTALWDLDVLTGKVRWSQQDDSLLGKSPVELELSWEKFLERVPEEDRDDLYRRTLATLQDRSGNDDFVTEWRYHEPGGGERWVLFRGRVYRDVAGHPLRLRGVNVDITELKQAKSELVELTERLIQAQESERQRLARELHDDIGQRLSLLIIGLDRLRDGLPVGLREQREELATSLEEASQLATDVHGLAYQLHSSKLKHLGLKAALRELCEQVSRQHGVEVSLQARTIPGEVSEERALCLYRVAQEALNNAVKHSGSSMIAVELAPNLNMLRLSVKDYGTGFDVNHYSAGVGLASMRERIRMAAGKLQISSKPGVGTEVITEVAMEQVAKHAGAH